VLTLAEKQQTVVCALVRLALKKDVAGLKTRMQPCVEHIVCCNSFSKSLCCQARRNVLLTVRTAIALGTSFSALGRTLRLIPA